MTKLAPNIWDDGRRYIALAKVGRRHTRRKRFPRTTPLRTITTWIEEQRSKLRTVQRQSQRLKGQLVGAFAVYVATLPKGRGRANTRSYLQAWAMALGEVSSSRTLTEERLQAVITAWIDAGIAASSLKHRRRALAQCLEAQKDHTTAAIVRGLKLPREPQTPPRGAEMHLLHAIISGMDEDRSQRNRPTGRQGFRNKARARLLLWLWTGAEPATQQRIAPTDIDLARGTITLPPRQKGDGVEGITLPFLGEAAAAAAAWLRAFAWGPFTARALGRAFQTAVRRYITAEAAAGRTVTLPADLTPKHLRHSFLSWLHEHCEDIDVVQKYAQHLHVSTTQRYTKRVVDKRLAAAAAKVNARHHQAA